MRMTKNRKVVYDLLLKASEPLTAYQLSKQLPDVSLTTIYRALDYLVNENYLKYFVLNDSKYYYVSINHKHFFQCVSCNRLFVLEECRMNSYEEELEDLYGFEIHEHFVFFSGLCNTCRMTAESKRGR